MRQSKTITGSTVIIILSPYSETLIQRTPLRAQKDQNPKGEPANGRRGNIIGQLLKRSLASI